MIFIPFPNAIEVKPFEKKGIVLDESKSFLESGEVLSVGDNVTFFQVGDVAYFDSWKCREAKDQDGISHFVVTVDGEGTLGKTPKIIK